jgi:hypothetical protein
MSRRRRKEAWEGLPQLAGLLLLAVCFVPGVSKVLLWGAAAGFILLATFVIFRGVTGENPFVRRSDGGKSSGLHFHGAADGQAAAPVSLGDRLRGIDWFQFEKLLAAVYRAKRYQVQRMGGARPDGGVDLVIEREGSRTVVQCKHWKSWMVKVRDIREFLGTLTDQKISQGIYVTLKGYTNDAEQFARKHGIVLLDERGLIELLEDLDWRNKAEIYSIFEDTRKICPKCENQMVLRTARAGLYRGGRFWGCSTYPRCDFKLKVS